MDAVIIGGDLYLKNKKESNLDEYSHLDSNKGIDKHRVYFEDKLLPILKQFKHGKVYVCFGNADLYSDVEFMKEKTKETNIVVLYNEMMRVNDDLEIMAYSSIVFMKGHKKDFERFDTKDVKDTLAQNVDSYVIRTKGYTTFDAQQLHDIILNNEYANTRQLLEENPSEDSHFRGKEGFYHFKFDVNDSELVKAFSIERELERIEERYSFSKENCKNQIWICHMPPKDTCCDNISDFHCGSIALRRFIEKHEPAATFHGHFHSSVDSSKGVYCSSIVGNCLSFTSGNYPKSKEIAMIKYDTETKEHSRVLV
ncbi:predicted protein [Naegleria gruberi]|uniref:Predicted protein n=1 Tax=Naegleria gruberi TaxID=5762 RepID=D2VA97_NAEGR|nr:uncharacterized protein NAEGRDRAFT_65783 [Naegleria gruberi]EFC46391.1 predicted protein [Naegleria gruberi]|eukprot:XP_002679135.1 predicted protein [Naegleria gruberi strain NEG-M]